MHIGSRPVCSCEAWARVRLLPFTSVSVCSEVNHWPLASDESSHQLGWPLSLPLPLPPSHPPSSTSPFVLLPPLSHPVLLSAVTSLNSELKTPSLSKKQRVGARQSVENHFHWRKMKKYSSAERRGKNADPKLTARGRPASNLLKWNMSEKSRGDLETIQI